MDPKLGYVGYEDGDGAEAESELSLRFDWFGDGRLRGLADDQGRTLEEILVDALAHLEVASGQGRLAAVPPRFLAGREDAGLSVQLAAESPRLEHLRTEARDRHVPLERLVEHALLLYLADLDTGLAPSADPELA